MMQIGKTSRPVLVKRYARRRLYRPDIMTYLTREDLIAMATRGKRFVVVDAETGEDVTASLHPIMVGL
jgi:polyhydroxyalkanoate synthesis regulator protein